MVKGLVDIAFGYGTGVLLPGLVCFMEGIVDVVVGRGRVLDWAADVDAGLTSLPVLSGVALLRLPLALGDRLLSGRCFLSVLLACRFLLLWWVCLYKKK